MKIYRRDYQSYEFDGIDDICCEELKKAYEGEDIVAERYDEKITLRCWDFYLEEYNKYQLKYCPFCGKKIKIK